MSNRREFVTAATGGVVLASLGVSTSAAACPSMARRVGGSPALAAFEALRGQDFRIDLGAGERASLRLMAVHEYESLQPLEQFTLVLRNRGKKTIEAGVYRLEHAQAGSFQLRLDASGSDALGQLYRADFSLLV